MIRYFSNLQHKEYKFLLCLLSLVPAMAGARTLSGSVTSGKSPLANVVVTDGLNFALTDEHGQYSIEMSADAEFVFIVTPKGYTADASTGIPHFYEKIVADRDQYSFPLTKLDGDADKCVMIGMADTQVDTDSDVKRMMTETLPDAIQTLSAYPNSQKAAFIAGDITWDKYALNAEIKTFAQKMGVPLYPVIGNHDYDKYMEGDAEADYAHIYKEAFGPTYYAFQFGDAYYVVLNNIKYTGKKHYKPSLEIGHQMEWLKRLLHGVFQMDSKIYVVMHAPLRTTPDSPLIPGGDEFVRLLDNLHHAEIFSGHYHTNTHQFITTEISEHNMGAACGFWWMGNCSGDGTPNGYEVITQNGKTFQSYYKATGANADYQAKLYFNGEIADRPDDLVVEVWDWSPKWQIRWYENNELKGSMEQFYSYDPEYLALLNGRRAVGDYVPQRTNHYFSAHPSSKNSKIRIEIVDSNGRMYQYNYPE